MTTTVHRASDLANQLTHGIYHRGRLVAIVTGGTEYAKQVITARAQHQGIHPDEYTSTRVRVTDLVLDEQQEKTYSVQVQATSPQEARDLIRRDVHSLTLTEGAK